MYFVDGENISFDASLVSFIYIYIYIYTYIYIHIYIHRVSQKEWTKFRDSVPYVKIYRYNPKHLYQKLTVTEIMAREV